MKENEHISKDLMEFFDFGMSNETQTELNGTEVPLGQNVTFVVSNRLETEVDYKLTNCWATPVENSDRNVKGET